MRVYGDSAWSEAPREILDAIEARLHAAPAPGWIARHARLVDAWLNAGILMQAIADDEYEARGFDELSALQDAAMQLLMSLARHVVASWQAVRESDTSDLADALSQLRRIAPRRPLRCKLPEGHAFYALYPESYCEAAKRLAPGSRVIGLRSIGACLSAIVAAALGSPPPLTLRPDGHPFRRELAVGPRLRDEILRHAAARWVIVDEGPGLSGSSFAAAAALLVQHGVPEDRIDLMPGHAGDPGHAATPDRRAWWARARRHVVSFDQWALHGAEDRNLSVWFADLAGAAIAPLEDIGAGGWRSRVFAEEGEWPPVWPQQERRKFLLRTAQGTFLLKFAGLGRIGAAKFEHGRALAAAGLSPPVLAFRHGFLLQPWIEARTLGRACVPRDALIEAVGRYIGFRARHFGATRTGASLSALLGVTRHNLSEWGAPVPPLDVPQDVDPRPIAIDGRLHPWEWLVTAEGRLLKADALDHHAAHDLVGCQDVTWDLAGAWAELGVSKRERDRLCTAVEAASGRAVDRRLLRLMQFCYPAFQLGRAALAAQSTGREEAARLTAAAGRYARLVASLTEAEA